MSIQRKERKQKTNSWKAGIWRDRVQTHAAWRGRVQTHAAWIMTLSIGGSMISMFRLNEANPLMTAMQIGPVYLTRGWPLPFIHCFGGGDCSFSQIEFVQNWALWFAGLALMWVLLLGIYELAGKLLSWSGQRDLTVLEPQVDLR
ncbi:MAG: hypothetical protein AAF902_03040 [Chloroflexota bacterium]